MASMDAKRLELYELLKPKLDEEPARALVLALPPEPESLMTKEDLFVLYDARMEARFAKVDARFDRMESTLTRRMVTIMGAWTVLVGSTIGWVVALLR